MATFISKFEDILKAPGYSLKQFFRTAADDLFPEAEYRPEVFQSAATGNNRLVKQFLNNPHSNLRIFYFQLLRLCYSSNICHSLGLCNKLKKIVLNPHFQILFSFDTQQHSTLFNNRQFKKLFVQFIDHLDHQQQPCIQNSINDYPIIDIVMIHILRSLLATRNVNPEFHTKIDTTTVFKQLSDIFKLRLSIFENYWVFQDNDFFVHAENDWQLYISYKQKRLVQEQIKRRKYINGLLLNKPSQSQSTTQSIAENIIKPVQQKQMFPTSVQIFNVTSPKNKPQNKMFMTSLNFSQKTNSITKFNQKQSVKPHYYFNKGYDNQVKKVNPEITRRQNYEIQNRTLRKGVTGSESFAYLGFRNKENNPIIRNISFDTKRQHRSLSAYKGEVFLRGGRFFKN